MSTNDESFDLSELIDRAGVTPRTVRYYVQQGLLPSPGARGRGARYDQRHLDRLRLIRRLQREHLPLAEIRRRLGELDDASVRALLDESPATRARSALDYIRDVLASGIESHSTARETRSAAPVRGAPHRGASRRPAAALVLGPPRPSDHDRTVQREARRAGGGAPRSGAADSASTERSVWERIALAPDVELHVRRPLTRMQNKLVDRLIAHARDLFTEEP